MDIYLASIVLLAALMHAGWNLVVKRDDDQFLALTLMAATSGIIAAAILPALPLPARSATPYLLTSAALHAGYRVFLAAGYRYGDLSQVYPVARGAAPVIVAILAYVFANERLSVEQIIGMLLIASGIVSLAFRKGLPSGHEASAIGFGLATAWFIACYTVLDGLGARLANAAFSYALWLFVLEGLLMLILGVLRSPTALLAYTRRKWKICALSGLIMSSAHALVIWALTIGDLALVSALRETSVLFATILGAFYLHEKLGVWRIACATVVFAGLILVAD